MVAGVFVADFAAALGVYAFCSIEEPFGQTLTAAALELVATGSDSA